VGESVLNGALQDTRRPPGCIVALQGMGVLPGRPFISLNTHGTCMDTISVKIQSEESSMAGASRTGSTEGSEYRELGGFGRGNWAGFRLCKP
jgi:hypothetical protein